MPTQKSIMLTNRFIVEFSTHILLTPKLYFIDSSVMQNHKVLRSEMTSSHGAEIDCRVRGEVGMRHLQQSPPGA